MYLVCPTNVATLSLGISFGLDIIKLAFGWLVVLVTQVFRMDLAFEMGHCHHRGTEHHVA